MIKRRHLLALILFAIASAPCFADIYAFVDEHGHATFSNMRLDSRYQLYMKEKPRVDQPAAPQAIAEAEPSVGRAALVGGVPAQSRKRYADMITQVAREQKVEAALIHAVVAVESAYNARAKSPKGATGLMQLMPDTAKRYGVSDVWNPLENLRGGTRYLRDLLFLFNNNHRLAIAAYNAGEGAVMKSGNAIPPYRETRAYVPRVLQHYHRYRAAAR